MIVGIDCGYRTGGVALIGDDHAEVHDLPVFDEGGVDVAELERLIRTVADLIEERMDMGDITTVLYGSMEVTIAALVNCGLPVGTLALAVMDMAEQAKHEQKTAGRA